MGVDFWIVLKWWGTLFFVGAIAFPLTKKLFSSWYDQGYFFAKAVGLALVTYLVYILGIIHLLPFTVISVAAGLALTFFLGVFDDLVGSGSLIRRFFHMSGIV